jgi:hypothetical protein
LFCSLFRIVVDMPCHDQTRIQNEMLWLTVFVFLSASFHMASQLSVAESDVIPRVKWEVEACKSLSIYYGSLGVTFLSLFL